MKKWQLGIELVKLLEQHGFEAYIVGGAVRDYFLKHKILDVDITTNALPEDLEKFLDCKINKTYLSSKVKYKGILFEITTFRIDKEYIDHRHPIVESVNSIREDLKRRDFTMNSIAVNSAMQIIDLYHGLEDIQAGIVRSIGDPHLRFNEDALRVLRAIELTSRYNFDLAPEIIQSFSVDYLKFLKEEYLISMLEKILQNPYDKGLQYLVRYKLLRSFPFYQVLIEEVLHYSCKEAFGLFYAIHNFLPSDLKLKKSIITKSKDIAFLVRNGFNEESLYYGNPKVWKEAAEVYSALNTKIEVSIIESKYKDLPIHRVQDIDFDFNQIPVSLRGQMIHKIEKMILNKTIQNQLEDILKELRNII